MTSKRKTSISSDSSGQSESLPQKPVNCLINKYKQTFPTVGDYWRHVQANDNLDMFKIFELYGHHGYIRIVNYFRIEKIKEYPSTDQLLKLYGEKLNTDIKYLTECLNEDPYLIYSGDLDLKNTNDDGPPDLEPTENVICDETQSKPIEKINGKSENSTKNSTSKSNRARNIKFNENKNFKSERDDDYFDGYGDLSIHLEMISDYERTNTYKRGLESGLLKNKIVLDVGAGSAILSIFAARAGAKHVYAVEPSAVASDAQEIITENGFNDKITIIRKMSEDLTLEDLDGNKPDYIISEWMGYFLYFEGMLPSVLKAKQIFGNTAKMLPRDCSLYLGLLTSPHYTENMIRKWKDPYLNPWGLKFSPFARYNTGEVLLDLIPEWQISGCTRVHHLDLNKCEPDDVDFEANFKFENLNKNSKSLKIYGIVGWFTTGFTDDIILDTSPSKIGTHWKQTVFPLRKVIHHTGKTLDGYIKCKRLENGRDLDIILQFPEKKFDQQFYLD